MRELGEKRRIRVTGESLFIRPRREVAEEVGNALNVADILGAASGQALANSLQAKKAFRCSVTGAAGFTGEPGFGGFVIGAYVGGDARRGTAQLVVQYAFCEISGCGLNVAVGD